MVDLGVLLTFTVLGLLGGLAVALLLAKKWKDLYEFSFFRRVVAGAISGFIYYFLWSDWSYPNAVMAFVAGMWGTDFLERLRERFRPR